MNLDYLNHLIPKRWMLLLYYWLPFFPTPSTFYFKCRGFIDQFKDSSAEEIPLEKFPDLLLILEEYAAITNEKETAKKIIDEIFARKTRKVRLNFLVSILEKFSPENKNAAITKELLRHIPDKLYTDYFNLLLKGKNCSSLNLKWCAYFRDKFSLEDRLTLCLSLPDDKLTSNQATLSKLVIGECEEKFKHEFDLSLLNIVTTERLLNIIFTRPSSTLFSKNLLRSFINQLLKKAREATQSSKSSIASYLRPLDVSTRYQFFKDFLAQQNNQENIEYFLSLCPAEQWPTLIDHIIVSVFNATDASMNNDRLTEESPVAANPNLLLLTPLQKQAISFPVNLFQFLAIQYLSKQTFNLNVLKKVFAESQESLDHHQTFSPALQSVVAESQISAIKAFIQDHIMIHVPKENKRHDIHHVFKQFRRNEPNDKSLNITTLILEKLPEDLQASYKADLNFLQQLLSQLYLIVADPLVVKYKNEQMLEQNKNQRDYEERIDAIRELQKRITSGEQDRVSHQRMEELFGDQSPLMQEKWKKLGVHFFDAHDPEELKLAKREAEEMKKIHSKYTGLNLNEISHSLSTSPSLTSYLNS